MLRNSRYAGNIVNFCFIGISLALSTVFHGALPEQFSRDSLYIQARLGSATVGETDSFQTVANLLSAIGLAQFNIVTRTFMWFFYFTYFIILLRLNNLSLTSFRVSFVTCLYFSLVPFYGVLPNKEFIMVGIILTVVIIINLISRKIKKVDYISISYQFYIIVAVCLLIGYALRPYYFITAIVFINLYIFRAILAKSKMRVLIPLIALSILSTIDKSLNLSYNVFQLNIFDLRRVVQASSPIVANSSIIQMPVTDNLIQNFFGYLSVLQQLLIPIHLIDQSFYGIFRFVIASVIGLLVIAPYLSHYFTLSPVAVFLFSYFTVALIFEPDSGSYIRHSFIWLPLMLFLWNEKTESAAQRPIRKSYLEPT